jgi:DNA-binding NarL/FixJ family response regulator
MVAMKASSLIEKSVALPDAPLLRNAAGKVRGLASVGPTACLVVHDILMLRRLECVLDLAPEANADVLVVDLADGEAPPETSIAPHAVRLVLTDEPRWANDASLQGVLPRSASSRQIAAAVVALAEGLTVRDPSLRRPVPDAAVGPSNGSLTPREAEILTLIGRGMSNKAIARSLGISAHTVKYHLEAVFAKLGVRSRAEAATQGMRRGIVVL